MNDALTYSSKLTVKELLQEHFGEFNITMLGYKCLPDDNPCKHVGFSKFNITVSEEDELYYRLMT